MKKRFQIITIIGTITVTVSATLGVYFSSQYWNTESNRVYNFGEKFFRKNVITNKNYLYNQIILLDGGENLGYLNMLDKLHFNNSNNKEFLKKDPKNNLLANDPLIIDYYQMLSITQIKNKYKELNKKINKKMKEFKKEFKMNNLVNDSRIEFANDLGIEFVKDVVNSKVEIKLFKIKTFNKEELKLIDDYKNDLGEINKPQKGWLPNKFFKMYSSKLVTSKKHLNEFNFSLSEDFDEKWPEEAIGSNINGKFFAEFRKKENNNEISSPLKKMTLNKKFFQKNIFSSIEPFVDFKNKKIKVVIQFYKTGDANTSINVDKTLLKNDISETNIWNPKAIKTIIFEYDLLYFGNTNAPSTTMKENKEILKNFFINENSISVWANKKVVNIVFSIIQEKIPQLLSYSDKIFFLAEIFGTKKYSSIFNENEKVELLINGKKQKVYFLEWILNFIKDNQYIDAEAFLTSANQFSSKKSIKLPNEKLSKYSLTSFEDWNNVEKLRYISYLNGGLYKIYHFHITINEIYDRIIEAIENKFGPINFKKNNQNTFRILFDFLKKKNLIKFNIDFNHFIDNYQSLIPDLLSKIAKNRIKIPKNIIEIILSFLSVSNHSEDFDSLVKNLQDLFLTDKFSLIWQIFGKDEKTRKESIKKLLSFDTSHEIIINILENDQLKSNESIQTLLNFLLKINSSSWSFNSLNSEKIYKFLTTKVKSGKTNGLIVSEIIKKVFLNGLKSIPLEKIKTLFEIIIDDSEKLYEKIYNFIQNGLGGSNQSNTNDSIKAIISLIKLFLNKFSFETKNNKDVTKWFDVNGISNTLNKFLNNGIDGLDALSYKSIFQVIFKNLEPIEKIAKKLALENQENITIKLRDFISKISYTFLNQGVSNFDIIKNLYNDFINDKNNLEIKIAFHTFINQKIVEKENQIAKINYVDSDSLNKLTGEWNSWNNKYIPKIIYKGFIAPTNENTINSLLEMNLFDFVLVFSEDINLDPIKILQKDIDPSNLNLENRLNFGNYLEYKNYFGTLFESFKRFYETDGQFIKTNKVSDFSDKFKNYNFLNKIKILNNNEKYKSFFDLLIEHSLVIKNNIFNQTPLNIAFNKILKLTINLGKTGLSTSKDNWIEHTKNILDLIKNITPIIDSISKLAPSISQYINKYIYELVELFEIGEKQNDGNYNFIDPNDDSVGTKKIEEIATSISNVFTKSINDANHKNNISEKDINFVWKITKYFLKIINKDDKYEKNIENIPKKIPNSIKKILIDKKSLGDLSSSDIDELIFVISNVYPSTKKIFSVLKTFIKQFLIGKHKMYLEEEVKNFFLKNDEIEFPSYGDNKFLTHEEKILDYLQIHSKTKGNLNVEKLIIEDKNILLNKNTFVKFKAKYSYVIDKNKFIFISPVFKIKLFDEVN